MGILFNRTELCDRKHSEMLSEMRQLLETYDADNTQINAVLKKLFLDKLPKQARTILAANLETNLDLLALRAYEVVAALSQTIIETNMMRDKLSSLFQHTDTSTNTYQPSYILDATTFSIQNEFMQFISSISNPFINFLVTTAFALSLIWSIISTTWTLHVCASFLIQKVKNQTTRLTTVPQKKKKSSYCVVVLK